MHRELVKYAYTRIVSITSQSMNVSSATLFTRFSAVAALCTKSGDYIQKSADIKTGCSFLDVIYWLHRIAQSIAFSVILFKKSVEELQFCLRKRSLASRRAFYYHVIVKSAKFSMVAFCFQSVSKPEALPLVGLFYYPKKNNRESLHDCIYQKTAVLSSLRLSIRHISANRMPEMREIQGRLMAFFSA